MNTQELGLTQNVGSELEMPEVINGQVDARSMHEALQVRSDFRNWIKNRIEEFGFVEGQYYKLCVP